MIIITRLIIWISLYKWETIKVLDIKECLNIAQHMKGYSAIFLSLS